MYLMSKAFSWCSPDVYRGMSDWDKDVYFSILSGEGEAHEDMQKQQKKNNSKKKSGVGKNNKGVRR